MSHESRDPNPLEVRAAFTKQALEHDFDSGPLLLLAGPGAGKTYMLLETIKHQLGQGFDLGDFFEVTLTNASADDFLVDAKREVSKEFSESSTLHHRAKGILHKHARHLGLDSDFQVIDETSEPLVRKDIQHILGCSWSATGKMLRAYRSHSAAAEVAAGEFAEAYRCLQEFYVVLDWLDVVRLAAQVLEQEPKVREVECDKFRFLLVDEYQDLNEADQRLLRALLNGRTHFLAAGDDDQSIYGEMRFAHPKGILEFESYYPGASVQVLPVTSRLPSEVVAASASLLEANAERRPKQRLLSLDSVDSRADGGFVLSVNLKSDKAEREFLAAALHELIHGESPVSPKEILVLCQVTSLGRELVEWLRGSGCEYEIDCHFADGTGTDSDDVILRLLLEFVRDPEANLPLRGLLGVLADSETKLASDLVMCAMEDSSTLLAAVDRHLANSEPSDDLSDLQAFVAAAHKLDMWTPTLDGVELIVTEVPRFNHLSDRVDALRSAAHPESEIDAKGAPASVRFMTLHSSKGLDADFVFIPFMEDSIGPSARDDDEARRLLYVAMTRAKVGVVFTWAWSRKRQERFRSKGTGGPPMKREPSRRIRECGVAESLAMPWDSPTAEEIALELLRKHARVVAEHDRAI
ncbi:MAG: ATP-dependent helicase [Candidatus Eisenbacteria bacterium]